MELFSWVWNLENEKQKVEITYFISFLLTYTAQWAPYEGVILVFHYFNIEVQMNKE